MLALPLKLGVNWPLDFMLPISLNIEIFRSNLRSSQTLSQVLTIYIYQYTTFGIWFDAPIEKWHSVLWRY